MAKVNLKEKTVCVFDTSGQYTAIAERLGRKDGFEKVFYCTNWQHSFPKYNSYCVGMGVPNIERVDSLFDVIDICDIFVFPDLYFGAMQDWLRRQGKLVFGSGSGENMEIYRDEFFEMQKEVGLPVGKHEVVKGMTKLRKLLVGKENQWIKTNLLRGQGETFEFKNMKLSASRLDEMEHSFGAYKEEAIFCVFDNIEGIELGHDTFIVDGKTMPKVMVGIEIKDSAYCGKIIDYEKTPKVLKTIDTKLGFYFKEHKYRGFFSSEVRWNGKVGYFSDATCFSSDTEVLTDKGWKFFYDLDGTEKVCTMNPENRNIEYYKPYDYICQYFKGKMINMTNTVKTIDSLVTPNHSVWRTDRNNTKIFEERADSLTDKGFIPRVGNWNAKDIEFFELPEYHNEWDFIGADKEVICVKVKHESVVKVKMDCWLAFMGWYLSEGSIGGGKSFVCISQRKYVDEVRDVLNELGFKYSYSEKTTNFQIGSVQLVQELEKFGTCAKKYVPDYIKNCSARQIRIFLDNFMLGDGSIDRGRYYTTSVRLRDDIQELIMKTGKVANYVNKGGKGTFIKEFGYYRNNDIYNLEETSKRTDYWFETQSRKDRYIKEVDYDGFVYDVTVRNHVIYVRRNGKPYFSGNCRAPQPPSDLMLEIYDNFPEMVWEIASGNVPEIKATKKYGCQIIVKSSWATNEPCAIYFPEKYKNNVKIKSLMYKDGQPYFVPLQDFPMEEIGSIVATGSTLKEAIENARAIAKEVEGDCLKINTDCLDEAAKEVEELKSYNITLF